MLSILLVIAAAYIFFGPDQKKASEYVDWLKEHLDPKIAIAVALAVAALLLIPAWGRREVAPAPEQFSLKGAFRGPTASADAALVGALLTELADEIEYDGSQPEPSIRTGAQVDQLRKTARVLRCRGESIGDRQPAARDKIAAHLEDRVGTDPGALTSDSRADWVAGLREVGRAASDAAH